MREKNLIKSTTRHSTKICFPSRENFILPRNFDIMIKVQTPETENRFLYSTVILTVPNILMPIKKKIIMGLEHFANSKLAMKDHNFFKKVA